MEQWFIIENDEEYFKASARYEEIKEAKKGTMEHRELILLVNLLSTYGKEIWNLGELDPIEQIKIRMEDFGYNAADLSREYGDKVTVSKVLNYKQALSLTMIRKFSRLLRIPAELLIREYELKTDKVKTTIAKPKS